VHQLAIWLEIGAIRWGAFHSLALGWGPGAIPGQQGVSKIREMKLPTNSIEVPTKDIKLADQGN